jgi:hypothetical protein
MRRTPSASRHLEYKISALAAPSLASAKANVPPFSRPADYGCLLIQ